MSIKLQVKKTFCHLSGKVKAVDMHPEHPWVLSALYSGIAQIYNYEAQVNFYNFPNRYFPFLATSNPCRPLSSPSKPLVTISEQVFSSRIEIGLQSLVMTVILEFSITILWPRLKTKMLIVTLLEHSQPIQLIIYFFLDQMISLSGCGLSMKKENSL